MSNDVTTVRAGSVSPRAARRPGLMPAQLRFGATSLPMPPLSALSVPILAIFVLAMLLLPLPAPLLDFLFTFNIALSLLVLLVAVYSVRPLDFAVFPTVLLVTTLLRLSLN